MLGEKDNAVKGPMAKPSVAIDWDVYQKIMYWVRKAPGEISGLGKIVPLEDGTFRVISACLVQQENGSASTDMDGAAVAKAMYELREQPGHLNFWWHSHVNMGVFWSGTDTDTIREIGSQGWLVATVFNKKNEHKSAFYVKADGVLPEVFIDDISTRFPQYLKQADVDRWDAEYTEKTKVKYSYTGNTGHWDKDTGKWVYPQARASIQDTHDWVGGEWVPKKKSLTKKEKKLLRKAEKEKGQTASTQSSTGTQSDAITEEVKQLRYECDVICSDFYIDEITYDNARKVLNRIVGTIAISDVSEQAKEIIKEEYIMEFNQLFKEEIAAEEREFANMGYC